MPSTSATGRCGGSFSLTASGSGWWSRKTFSGNVGIIFSATQRRASTGSLPQIVGQGDRISTKEKPPPSRWISSALRIARARFHDVLVVGKRHAFDVDRRFEGGEQFRHVHRKAFVRRPPAPRRSRAFLPDQGGGRHLSAGHAVDCVVHEKDGDLLAAVGGMDDFGGADRRQVAVSLIGDDDRPGQERLIPVADSGRAAVRDLHVAHVEIVIGEDRAADRTHEDRLVLQPEFLRALRQSACGPRRVRSRGSSGSGAGAPPCARTGHRRPATWSGSLRMRRWRPWERGRG